VKYNAIIFHLSGDTSRLIDVRMTQALVDDANACRRKMDNATTLIDGLSGERARWTEASKSFEAETGKLVGDVLLATGFLSYSGPFNQEFRTQMMMNWKTQLRCRNIPFSSVSLCNCLSDKLSSKKLSFKAARRSLYMYFTPVISVYGVTASFSVIHN